MDDHDLSALIRVLRRIQSEEYLSIKGLAHRLGFSAGHLSMIYSGKRRPGIRFLRAVVAHFPQVRDLVARSLEPPSEEDE
jgi:transcriptional regulator with XRE-family HTH domain